MMNSIVLLSIDQLIPDPDNPRAFYEPDDLQAMAQSILDAGGVDQALLVMPAGDRYQVIDGHVRLEACRLLGDKAPLLKCEIRTGISRREKLLIMARTSTLWFAKDPISEGRHYQRLIEEEGMTRIELARALGRSASHIVDRLRLLSLDPEIQELVAHGRLSKDVRVVDALMGIGDREARLKLAHELAHRQASIKTTLAACTRLQASLPTLRRAKRVAAAKEQGWTPAVAIAGETLADEGGRLPGGKTFVLPSQIREAARQACHACDIREELLQQVEEPAWELVSHAADDTCDRCSLRQVQDACTGCALPEFLAQLARDVAAWKANERARAA